MLGFINHRTTALAVLWGALALVCFGLSAWRFQSWEADPPDWSRRQAIATPEYTPEALGVHRNIFLFRELRRHVPVAQGTGLFLMGTGFAVLSFSLRPLRAPVVIHAGRIQPAWSDTPLVLVGVLMLASVAEANAQLIPLAALQGMSHHIQAFLFVLGAVAVAAGLGGIVSAPPPYLTSVRIGRETRLVLLLTALALFLRVWELQNGVRVLVDEVPFLSDSRLFSLQPDVALLAPLNDVFPFTK
ncbi:MAG: hypothetical protein ACLFTK_12395, partial [Anaerolineales bacterium]